jgi:hypothetical protein
MQNRKLYVFRFAAFVLLAGLATFATACKTQSTQTNSQAPQEVTPVDVKTAAVKFSPAAVRDATESLVRFAEGFEPKSKKDRVIPSLPELNAEVNEALEILIASDSTEHLKSLTLIILKLNRFYSEHFHQDYDLRVMIGYKTFFPKLLEEYCRRTRLCDEGDEMAGSGMAAVWVERHPELLEYLPVKQEIERTTKVVEAFNKKMEAKLTRMNKGK